MSKSSTKIEEWCLSESQLAQLQNNAKIQRAPTTLSSGSDSKESDDDKSTEFEGEDEDNKFEDEDEEDENEDLSSSVANSAVSPEDEKGQGEDLEGKLKFTGTTQPVSTQQHTQNNV